ncbi:SMC-Scp complex subunit ScpB [archaeon SCG-AAA382B04]|nr:SMC-Scp complex subunit ScpB [archaeon SCG-AAA382B04]
MENEKVVEAALFTAGSPLNKNEISKVTGLKKNRVEELVKKLRKKYQKRNTALEIKKIGKKYVMQVKTEYSEEVRKLAPKDISEPVLRTLSLIAFRQPVRQSEVVNVRGNKSYSHISELEEKSLVDSEPQGRTKLLYTTNSFSEYFGIDAVKPSEVRENLTNKFDKSTLEDFFDRNKNSSEVE